MRTNLAFTGAVIPVSLIASLEELIGLCFGGMRLSALPVVSQRVLVLDGERVVAHAAAQARIFGVLGKALPGYILGFICTHPLCRQKGLGTAVTQALLQKLDARVGKFAVLNCGERVAGFYEKLGFRRIAGQAEYLRDGRRIIDADPIFACGLEEGFDLQLLCHTPFPLIDDF